MRLCFALAACLPLLLNASFAPFGPRAAQDPAQGGLAGLRAETLAKNQREIVGVWRLTRFEHVQEYTDPDDIEGVFQFGDGFMSMTIHARRFDTDLFDPDLEFIHQAGMHQYEFDQRGRLRTASVLASSTFSGELVFEEPNTPREYEVQIAGDSLTLTRSDGTRLVLQRLRAEAFPEEALRRLEEARLPGYTGGDGR